MSETEPTTSTNESSTPTEKPDEVGEPEAKRRKVSIKNNKLEDRLGGILCCAVCLDLPRAAVYQCSNGHLMCAGCFTQVLADARLRDETATCSSCRVEISKTSATRNLAVENTVSELPSECRFCNMEFPRNSLERHESEECDERISGCKFHRIGCPWRGPVHERTQHEQECNNSHKSIPEVMDALQQLDQQVVDKMKLFDTIFELLVYEKITFNDIQLKPYRSDEFFAHRLFYESSRFSAFSHQWLVKARINNSQKDPSQSTERDMAYQLVLKSKISSPMNVKYIILRSPFDDVKVNPRIYHFEFNEQEDETPFMSLPLPDTVQCNRLLAAKTIINLRLIMFLTSK